jgi:N-methylhydantoinase B
VVIGALAPAIPEAAVGAANGANTTAVFFGHDPRYGRDYVYLETLGGGSGARFDADGMDAVHVHLTNTSNLPAEALENEYPLMVDEYALVEDSGGAGEYRGGLGIARQIRAVVPGTIFSVRSDSHTVGVPSGVFGGKDGRRAKLIRNYGRPDQEELFSKVARVEMKVGDAMRIETPGAGGYGPPAERSLEAVARDLRSGKVTRAAAERDYGVEHVRAAMSKK